MSSNKLGVRGGVAIAETLQTNMNITHCNLRGNELSDKTAEHFAESLKVGHTTPLSRITYILLVLMKVNYKLRELDLSHNKLNNPSGTVLGPAIGESSHSV